MKEKEEEYTWFKPGMMCQKCWYIILHQRTRKSLWRLLWIVKLPDPGRAFRLPEPTIPFVFRQRFLRIPLTSNRFRWVPMISLPPDSGQNFGGKFRWLPGWFRLEHVRMLTEPAVKIPTGIRLQGNRRKSKGTGRFRPRSNDLGNLEDFELT